MRKVPKCGCGNDVHLVASGYLRRTIKHDGTVGYMFLGQEDGREEFLICSHVKCNSRYEVRRLENGTIIRGPKIV